MGKLMRVTRGSAFLVAVDIRKGSPTLGKWFGVEASGRKHEASVGSSRLCAGVLRHDGRCRSSIQVHRDLQRRGRSAIRWDDPDIGIAWPVKDARLSDKDRNAQTLKDWLASADSEKFSYEPQVALSR